MVGASITVIAKSPSLRESVSVALAARHRLAFATATELKTLPPCDLLVIADDEALPAELESELARRAHVRWRCSNTNPPLPEELRRLVRDALAAKATRRWPNWLVYPAIPRAAEAVAARAGASDLPVLITGEAGSGKRRLARQIHRAAGGTSLLVVAAQDFSLATLNAAAARNDPGRTTLLLTEIGAASAEALSLVARILDEGGLSTATGWRPLRLVCTSVVGADDLAAVANLDRDLFYRMAVLPIHLPPLRQRGADLVALAREIVHHAPRTDLGSTPVQLSPEAQARVELYPWPGNLAELETVLTRSVVLCDKPRLGAADLLFDPAQLERRSPPAPPPAMPLNGSAPTPPAKLELFVNELAHELKNPMVTIKTVAQHLERQLDNDADDREMARMTGAAVDRMDRAIENLLRFARFTTPAPANVGLADLAADCIEGLAADLAERRVVVDDRVGPGATAYVDRSQVVYALESLLRAVLRAAGERTTFVLRAPRTRRGLVLEFPHSTGSVTEKLSRWADGTAQAGAVEPSMHFVFGKALIERNGGGVGVQDADGRTTIAIDLPRGKDESDQDEEAAHIDR